MSQLSEIDGERGIPNVNTQTGARWKRGAVLLLMVLAVVAGSFVGYLKFGNASEKVEPADTRRTMKTASTVKPRTFSTIIEPAPLPPKPQAAAPVLIPAPVAQPVVRQYRPAKQVPKLDKAASRSAVLDNRTASNATTPTQAQVQGNTSGGFFGNTGAESSQANAGNFASLLQPAKLTATSARWLGNRSLMIAQGAFIDCALNTRLDSTVPGMASCVVSRDVFSDDGNLVLIERGSLVTGEYRSNLKQGMSRIFVLWNRVKTPGADGVVINLNSPGTGALGASGVAGHVDTHFWQRFGGAFLLSLVDDVARAATSSANNSENTQIALNSAGRVSSDLAAEILRNTINIPPTLYVNQGSRVGIHVARDLDFSNVYDAVPQ